MTKHLYLIVVGSRTFHNYDLLKEECDKVIKDMMKDYDTYYVIHIVSGGAKGADALAERYAKEKDYDMIVFIAEWDKYGKSAGYKRNVLMHESFKDFPDRMCIAFWDGVSKGTQHSFKLCEKYGTKLKVVKY